VCSHVFRVTMTAISVFFFALMVLAIGVMAVRNPGRVVQSLLEIGLGLVLAFPLCTVLVWLLKKYR
jgi:hypothetical protein